MDDEAEGYSNPRHKENTHANYNYQEAVSM